eukprot:9356198-Pyramimonas_sp.AAC.1
MDDGGGRGISPWPLKPPLPDLHVKHVFPHGHCSKRSSGTILAQGQNGSFIRLPVPDPGQSLL